MSQELVAPFPETTVIATNRPQMEAAQDTLIKCAIARRQELRLKLDELEQNLVIAKKNKLKLTTLQGELYKVKRRITFYEKLQNAFEAGFVLIPDMGVDVFAIRTSKARPKQAWTSHTKAYSFDNVWLDDQVPDQSPVGEGEYRDPTALKMQSARPKEDVGKDGKPTYTMEAWNDDWKEEITFPFLLAKPQIVDLTTRAMALKIFDDLGVLPSNTKADPMVIGRIHLKEGYASRTLNFLVAWFVDTKTL